MEPSERPFPFIEPQPFLFIVRQKENFHFAFLCFLLAFEVVVFIHL